MRDFTSHTPVTLHRWMRKNSSEILLWYDCEVNIYYIYIYFYLMLSHIHCSVGNNREILTHTFSVNTSLKFNFFFKSVVILGLGSYLL